MAAIHLLLQPRMQQARHVGGAGDQLRHPLAQFTQQALAAVALAQDGFQNGFCHRPNVDARVQLAAHAFDIEQGFLQQDQLRLQRQFVALCSAEQFHQHFGQ